MTHLPGAFKGQQHLFQFKNQTLDQKSNTIPFKTTETAVKLGLQDSNCKAEDKTHREPDFHVKTKLSFNVIKERKKTLLIIYLR